MTYSASRLTLYAIISAIEVDLRNAIRYHLSSEGDAKAILGEVLYLRSLDRFKRDQEDVPDASLEDLLSYIDFADCHQTLNSHASLLPKSVSLFLSRSVARLEKLTAVRNRVAHGRPLLFDDFARTLDTAQEFIGDGALPWESLRATLVHLKSEPSFVLGLNIPTYSDAHNHNLPIPDFDETGFIGRKEEVEEVKKLCLGPYPVVTIVGEGGLGKTALALKVAYDLLDSPECPFESIVWTSSKTNQLTAVEITKIQNAISDSLGLFQSVADKLAGTAVVQPIEEVLSYLKQFKILLILDNLETVLDDRLREFLRHLPPGSKILITSRIGLGAFEVPFKLNPLVQNEAVHLLRALARTRNVQTYKSLQMQDWRSTAKRCISVPGSSSGSFQLFRPANDPKKCWRNQIFFWISVCLTSTNIFQRQAKWSFAVCFACRLQILRRS